MATRQPTGIITPDGSDAPNLTQILKTMGLTSNRPPVARNQAEADRLLEQLRTSGYPASSTMPVLVWRTDLQKLDIHDGTRWAVGYTKQQVPLNPSWKVLDGNATILTAGNTHYISLHIRWLAGDARITGEEIFQIGTLPTGFPTLQGAQPIGMFLGGLQVSELFLEGDAIKVRCDNSGNTTIHQNWTYRAHGSWIA